QTTSPGDWSSDVCPPELAAAPAPAAPPAQAPAPSYAPQPAAYAPQAPREAGPLEEVVPMTNIRKAISEAMSRSKYTAPEVTTFRPEEPRVGEERGWRRGG